MHKQATILQDRSLTGIGVHTGEKVTMTLKPADSDTGIIFKRVDCKPSVEIKADLANINESCLSTVLQHNNHQVVTIEHLMAALYCLGIDNLYIEINRPELPVMDGSAFEFIKILKEAGIKELANPKKIIKINKKLRVIGDNGEYLEILPYNGFKVTYKIAYDHPVFNKMDKELTIDLSNSCHEHDLYKARTFGFLSQYESLKKQGLARGSSLENTLVVGEDAIVNNGGLRIESEFIKHKMLDLLGDLWILHANILGYITGYKSGHALNHKLVKAVSQLDL